MSLQLSLQGVSYHIQSQALIEAIDLEVHHGDYWCIVGPNGSGKTTLARCLLGLLPLSAGEIHLNQLPLHTLSRKALARHISYVPQLSTSQLPFSVHEFVKMARYAHHPVWSDWQAADTEAVEHALQVTSTDCYRQRAMHALSGGERQRVMIAAALCQQTPIIVLDEPGSFLDPHHQVAVQELIRTLNRQHGITILEISHDINHAAMHAQHILALRYGQAFWQGAAADFLDPARLESLYNQAFVLTEHPQTGARMALPQESSCSAV